jgi:aerobic carbon-monoxide dehydrogenase small subunit
MRKQMATFIVNGKSCEVMIEPSTLLIEVLRGPLDLTGTKNSCGIGQCGACTVEIEGKPILACLTLAMTVREKRITTIEGISEQNRLHPIQQAFVDHGAIQCGFCSPGMIMTAKALLDSRPHPTVEEIKDALAGNLCRCTGYAKIVEAVSAASVALRGREE